MASIQDAIEAYRPELQMGDPVEFDEVVEYLHEKTGVEQETIRQVFQGIPDLAFWFMVRGRPIEVPGLGHLRPRVALDGRIYPSIDGDPELVERMSEKEAYRAEINRRENIGANLDRLAQMWNSSHPNDRIQGYNPYAVKAG